MTLVQTFAWIVAGILLSIAITPALKALYPEEVRGLEQSKLNIFWAEAKPYAVKLVASLIVAFAVMVISYATNTVINDWWTAVLVGFGANRGVDMLWQLRYRN